MADRQISAVKALKDIRAGMSDPALMEKYKISPVGLQSLYEELASLGLLSTRDCQESASQKIKVNVKDFLKDFRKGLTDGDLTEVYGLSRAALHLLYNRLLELKAIVPEELLGSEFFLAEAVARGNRRDLERYCLDFELVVVEAGDPTLKGTVKDISETGIRLAGIKAFPGDILTLVVHPDSFLEVNSFRFRAECRWSDTLGGVYVTGLRIIELSEADCKEIRKLIPLLELCC
ncbi:MAG: PilZ domain-containing protein [Desulfomonile tiedjei]|nr:PilZ domain-containing protein [Desulfomonile tiedjei]